MAQLQVTSYTVVSGAIEAFYEVPSAATTEVGPGGTEVEVSPKAQSSLVQTLVTGITICNVAGITQWITIRLTPAGGTEPADSYYINYFQVLAAETSWIFNHGLVLSPGDSISVTAWGGSSTVNSHFTLFGVETSSGTGPNS